MKTPAPFLVLGTLALMSCGGVHDAVRPDQPTASGALGAATIKPVTGPSQPLVVDWSPEARADLEEAIHDGIAIVTWDDKGLRLARKCQLAGDYGYLPLQPKKDVVRLESADEVAATLPLGGLGIAGKIGGGFQQGTTLDIALAMVGKRRTSWNEVSRDDLKGDCDGVTHYVRAVVVGAFAMKTGTHGKAAAAAELFGAGSSGSTESSKDVDSTDGQLDACEKATGEETKPVAQCGSFLRLELEPIASHSATAAAASETESPKPQVKAPKIPGCPDGFVFSGGACKRAIADAPHVCAPDDANDCDAQCQKGDATSCDNLGALIVAGKRGSPDPAAAAAAFQKACAGGSADGCGNLGTLLVYGPSPDVATGMKALTAGCLGGSPRACGVAGEALLLGAAGTKDPVRSLAFNVKGCEGGDLESCTNAGFLYAGGGGAAVQRDDVRAIAYEKRACFGGEPTACGNTGYKVELGEGTAANPALAMALYARGCRLDPAVCVRAGFLVETGATGVPKDDAQAKKLLQLSCKAGGGLAPLGCVVLGNVYGDSSAITGRGPLAMIGREMKPQCDQQEGRACTFLGIAQFGLGRKDDGQASLKQGCDLKDPLGCTLASKMR